MKLNMEKIHMDTSQACNKSLMIKTMYTMLNEREQNNSEILKDFENDSLYYIQLN